MIWIQTSAIMHVEEAKYISEKLIHPSLIWHSFIFIIIYFSFTHSVTESFCYSNCSSWISAHQGAIFIFWYDPLFFCDSSLHQSLIILNDIYFHMSNCVTSSKWAQYCRACITVVQEGVIFSVWYESNTW